ncbi:hypothetical protein SAMN04490220_4367 [Rhodococcus jostii]|uniref:Uncharacterized protein n=1 Tax=Rhodococcus jostii TaxID=132919 RepID=A0A1H5ABS4_RHOJO|nr:hypothetical protein SAMN04490220_4367 [Rhodococcus jostii]
MRDAIGLTIYIGTQAADGDERPGDTFSILCVVSQVRQPRRKEW